MTILFYAIFVTATAFLHIVPGYSLEIPVPRRLFVARTVATATAGVCCCQVEEAKADPINALFPVGSQGILQPYSEMNEGYSIPTLLTQLGKSRILANSISPLQQNNPFASKELYYPSFMLGSWDVTTTLQKKSFPFGKDFVPARSLIEGSPRNRAEKVGDSASFQLLFFSEDESNDKKIIADRASNAKTMSRGYNQMIPVDEVEWDYKKDPTRLTLRFGVAPVAEDMRPLGQRRGEVYLTARQTEASDDNNVFCGSERSRSVTLGNGSVITSDQETTTEYKRIDETTIEAISRISVFLTPNPNSREGILWQQIGGRAVAFYDYTWTMKKSADL